MKRNSGQSSHSGGNVTMSLRARIQLFVLGWTFLFLTACGSVETRNVVKTEYQYPAEALTEPTTVEPPRTRDEVRDNGELWDLAGRLNLALQNCNHDKADIRNHPPETPPEEQKKPSFWARIFKRQE